MRSLFVALLLVLQAFDASCDDLAKEVTNVFAKVFFETTKNELVRESINKIGEKALGTNGVGTAAFAAYGVYNGLDAYSKADSDSGRYYAATQTIASAVGYFDPGIGLILSLANVGQQLLGQAVTLNDQKALARTITEIQKIQERMQKTNERLMHSDARYLTELYSNYNRQLLAMLAYTTYLKEGCSLQLIGGSPVQGLKCLDVMTRLHYSKRLLLSYARRLIAWKGEFISFEGFLQAVSPDASVQVFNHGLSLLETKIQSEHVELRELREQAAKLLLAEALDQISAQTAVPKESICLFELQRMVNSMNYSHIRLSAQIRSGQLAEEELLVFASQLAQARRFSADACSDEHRPISSNLINAFEILTEILNRKDPLSLLALQESL